MEHQQHVCTVKLQPVLRLEKGFDLVLFIKIRDVNINQFYN